MRNYIHVLLQVSKYLYMEGDIVGALVKRECLLPVDNVEKLNLFSQAVPYWHFIVMRAPQPRLFAV